MHFGKWLIANLLTLPLLAQSGLYLSTETGEKFRVGLNDYAQEVTYRERILISKLDTGNHRLYLKLQDSTLTLNRSIRLPEEKNYHYLITQNFKGNYQIRYRGTISQAPSPTITRPYSSNVRWPQKEPAEIAAAAPTSNTPQSPTPKSTIKDSVPHSSLTALEQNKKKADNLLDNSTEPSPSKPKIDTISPTFDRKPARVTPVSELKPPPKKDTLPSPTREKKPAQDPGKVVLLPRNTDTTITLEVSDGDSEKYTTPPVDKLDTANASHSPVKGIPLQVVLHNLQKLQYEFEKQKYLEEHFHVGLAQPQALLAIFKEFKYDQTKLDLVKAFKNSILQYENWQTSLDGFQYEISKNKAGKILQ